MSGHMLRQLRHLDRRFDDRAGTRDRGAVGRQQGEFGRRDRLQQLGQRRGDREPADEQNEEKRERRKAPPDPAQPPAPAGFGPRRGGIGRRDRSEERRVGKEGSVRVDLGGRRIIKKKRQKQKLEERDSKKNNKTQS